MKRFITAASLAAGVLAAVLIPLSAANASTAWYVPPPITQHHSTCSRHATFSPSVRGESLAQYARDHRTTVQDVLTTTRACEGGTYAKRLQTYVDNGVGNWTRPLPDALWLWYTRTADPKPTGHGHKPDPQPTLPGHGHKPLPNHGGKPGHKHH